MPEPDETPPGSGIDTAGEPLDIAGEPLDIEVEPLDDEDAATVVAVLDASERAGGGVPLVDEGERRRLDALAAGGDRADRWFPVVAHVGVEGAGYGAIVVTGEVADGEVAADDAADDHVAADDVADDLVAVGDVAVAHDTGPRPAVLRALLEQLASRADAEGVRELQVWMRDVVPTDLDVATATGYRVDRRLAILGADLPVRTEAPSTPPAITVRASRPGEDDAAVVAVLAAAYGDGADGGWDLARFQERRRFDWFDPDDLLLAVDGDGRTLGLHWLKRRSRTVGEVYNLAVHPDAQGLRLGPTLLRAGLDHLAATGCEEVLLWVDRANERAVRLYTSQGMVTRWDDVAFGRTFRAAPPTP